MKWSIVFGTSAVLLALAASAHAAEPLSCTATDSAPGALPTLRGATTESDPTHKGHLRPIGGDGPVDHASTCAASNVAPPIQDAAQDFHFHSYAFRNEGAASACVTVQLYWSSCNWLKGECAPPPNPEASCSEGGCGGVGAHEATAYLAAFDPDDIRAGYLGDSGRDVAGPGQDHFSFDVPAQSDFAVVVTWAGPVAPAYQPQYAMYVMGCGEAAPPPTGGGDSDGGAATTPPPSGGEGNPDGSASDPNAPPSGSSSPPSSSGAETGSAGGSEGAGNDAPPSDAPRAPSGTQPPTETGSATGSPTATTNGAGGCSQGTGRADASGLAVALMGVVVLARRRRGAYPTGISSTNTHPRPGRSCTRNVP